MNEEEAALLGIVDHMLSQGKTVLTLNWEEISNALASRIGGDHRGHKAVSARWKMLDQQKSLEQVKEEVIEVNRTEKGVFVLLLELHLVKLVLILLFA